MSPVASVLRMDARNCWRVRTIESPISTGDQVRTMSFSKTKSPLMFPNPKIGLRSAVDNFVATAMRLGEGSILSGENTTVPRARTRRGFGSVIIERVVPYELQGTAAVRYLPAGLEADFYIPEWYVAQRLTPHYDAAQAWAANPLIKGYWVHHPAPSRRPASTAH
jgi:hypothetical protein